MIELMSDLPNNVIGFTAHGKVTGDDYENVVIPTIEARLKEHDKLRLIYNCGEEFEGFEAAAMWDDAKVGMKHLTAWEKIAVVTDVDWMRMMTKAFGFAIPAKVRVFENDDLDDARAWASK